MGLGQPVPGRWRTGGERAVDLLDEVGLQRRPASAHALQRRRVPLGPVGMGDQLAAHRRDAGEVGHPLALDQLEGAPRIPLVGEHDAPAGERRRVQQTVARGDVEQRRRRHEHGLRGSGGRCGRCWDVAGSDGLGLGSADRHRPEHQVHDVVHGPAVGQLRTLRVAGRARRVEDRGVVVGVDGGVGQGVRRGVRVDDVVPPGGIVGQLAVGAHRDHVQRGDGPQPLEHRQHALQPLVVGDEHLRPGVGEAVLHLRRRPPRVHADDSGADRRGRPVADHPFRVVAHRQRDPVTGPDAVLVAQVVGQGTYPCLDLGVRVTLVLVDDVGLVGVGRRHLPDRPHVRGSAGEDPHRHVAHDDLGHGEHGAGCGQVGASSAEVFDHGCDVTRQSLVDTRELSRQN